MLLFILSMMHILALLTTTTGFISLYAKEKIISYTLGLKSLNAFTNGKKTFFESTCKFMFRSTLLRSVKPALEQPDGEIE